MYLVYDFSNYVIIFFYCCLLFMCEYSSSNFNWHFTGLDYMKNHFVVYHLFIIDCDQVNNHYKNILIHLLSMINHDNVNNV